LSASGLDVRRTQIILARHGIPLSESNKMNILEMYIYADTLVDMLAEENKK